MLLLQAGDIETNPGPENIYDLSIVHLNIRSIRNKIEYISDNLLDFIWHYSRYGLNPITLMLPVN